MLLDFGLDDNIDNVTISELGRYAKNRDFAALAKNVLDIEIDKSENVRCSNWCSNQLSQIQLPYAACDAINSLDIYLIFKTKKDLSQRLSKEDAGMVGMIVDIVPPHTQKNNHKILRGYGRDINRMTRAAIGMICRQGEVVRLPQNLHPSRKGRQNIATVKDEGGNSTARVRIIDVLAKGLTCPHFSRSESDGSTRRACLGDFGKPNFEIVLPLIMLREHDPLVVVKAYGEERLASGWTEEEYDSMLYSKPSFFRERVKRVALPPQADALQGTRSLCVFWIQKG
jgi:3'-5' exonuclease